MVGLPNINKGLDDYYFLANNIPNCEFYWYCSSIENTIFDKYKNKIKFRVNLDLKTMFGEIEKKMNIMCNCSYYENFPLPVAEAMFMKKPIIIYKIKEIVEVYKNFIQYVDYGNVEMMKKAIREFQEGKYNGDINKAYSFIQNNYSSEIVSKKLLNILFN